MAERIIYIVPNLHESGGIQELAKAIYSELKDEFDLELVNWTNDLNLPIKAFLKFAPSKSGSYLYKNYFSNHFRSKYNIDPSDLIHFWHIEPAMAFLDKKYIISCLGMEVLPIYIKKYREIMYQEVLTRALAIHVISRYTEELIKTQFDYSDVKIRLIPPCINYSKFNNINKIKTDKIIIGTLTRFNKRKNVVNIIKSLNTLKQIYGLEFEYYLAGNGLERDAILKELQHANFEWKYFGELNETEKIQRFYPSLDIFVILHISSRTL